jgi:hypothetical protein
VVLFHKFKRTAGWPEERLAGVFTMLGCSPPLIYMAYRLNRFGDLEFNLIVLILIICSFFVGSSNYKFFKERNAKNK